MHNKKLHILLYSLLFVYILVSLGQHFHFKNEINKRTQRIEDLNTLISKNDAKVEQIRGVRESYEVLELYLDSTLLRTGQTQEKTISEVTPINTSTKEEKEENITQTPPVKTDSRENTKTVNKDSILVNNKALEATEKKLPEKEVTVNKPTKPTTEELRKQMEAMRSYFFEEITRVYYNAKKPRPIRLKDRNFWIEIESENGNYQNSLRHIIHHVTLNGNNLAINDIKESTRKTSKGFISTYYIQVKAPKGTIYQKNQLIITADKDYIKWFLAVD